MDKVDTKQALIPSKFPLYLDMVEKFAALIEKAKKLVAHIKPTKRLSRDEKTRFNIIPPEQGVK